MAPFCLVSRTNRGTASINSPQSSSKPFGLPVCILELAGGAMARQPPPLGITRTIKVRCVTIDGQQHNRGAHEEESFGAVLQTGSTARAHKTGRNTAAISCNCRRFPRLGASQQGLCCLPVVVQRSAKRCQVLPDIPVDQLKPFHVE